MSNVEQRLLEGAARKYPGKDETHDGLMIAAEAEIRGWRENAQCGWATLANIREVVTLYAPPGSLPSPEYADGPEHVHEADQIIQAIHAIAEARRNV